MKLHFTNTDLGKNWYKRRGKIKVVLITHVKYEQLIQLIKNSN